MWFFVGIGDQIIGRTITRRAKTAVVLSENDPIVVLFTDIGLYRVFEGHYLFSFIW